MTLTRVPGSSQSSVIRAHYPSQLSSCIKVIKEGVGMIPRDGDAIYHGVHFYLNEKTLAQAQLKQANREKLPINAETLTNLRYYALFGHQDTLATGLTFSTYYQEASRKPLMRSFVALDGDSIHQICQDCLQDEKLALDLALAHHWLIHQLLKQLHPDITGWLNWLAWTVSIPAVTATVLDRLEQFLNDPWMFILPPIVAWLLQDGIKRTLAFLLPVIGRWLLRWLLRGSWANTPQMRGLVVWIMRWLGF